jgi:hypothetical protein
MPSDSSKQTQDRKRLCAGMRKTGSHSIVSTGPVHAIQAIESDRSGSRVPIESSFSLRNVKKSAKRNNLALAENGAALFCSLSLLPDRCLTASTLRAMSRRSSRCLEDQALQPSAPVTYSNPFVPHFGQFSEVISRYDEPKVVKFMLKHPLKAFFEVRSIRPGRCAFAASQLDQRAVELNGHAGTFEGGGDCAESA